MKTTHRAPTGGTSLARDRRKQRGRRNPTDAWLLWMFFGWIGLHRYYIGDWKQGIVMTLTLGGLGVWSLLDGFLLGRRLRRINTGRV
ncbi:TM2 domain-containing protein [Kocuria sp.]|uniref:TM2 domain-containing protein n=1 Tax=Kocuria sp. TaxID=1871328 RepID=UPI0028111FEE|nr:TM2 domain-containing protein [Kocuria sp.]